ncbi:MAG TPA: hypothetical protein VK178_06705 [Opitutaceae bacterium]|nr:hypothetical protein [Opitutaceae bacterium]
MSPRSAAALLLLALPALLNGAVEIVRVWPTYRDADSFKRITEYVGGNENTGNEIVLRTQAEPRDGYYFLTRVKTDAAAPGASLVLEVVLPGNPAVHTYTFPADLPAGAKVFQLGVTGADWPSQETRPAAWRLTARAADGTVLAERSSFLWSGSPTAAK